MARVFVLGPSEWDPAKRKPASPSPLALRRELLATLAGLGHDAFVMEDEPDRPEEDMVEKFDRLIGEKAVTDIVVVWPRGAKMQTTFDEILLLRDRIGRMRIPTIWVLHQEGVARIAPGHFEVLEEGGRSRYLKAARRLGTRPIAWADLDDLRQKARLLAREL